MVDLKEAIEKRKAEKQKATMAKLRPMLRKKLDSANEGEIDKLLTLCEQAELDPAWLPVCQGAQGEHERLATIASTLQEWQAKAQAAVTEVGEAQRKLEQGVQELEADLQAAKARHHGATFKLGAAIEAARQLAALEEGFPALFGKGEELLGDVAISALPPAVQAALTAAGLPKRPLAEQQEPRRSDREMVMPCHIGRPDMPPAEPAVRSGWSATIS